MKAALLVLLLSGCAYDWHKSRPASEEVRVVDAPVNVIQAMPGCETGRHCAIQFPREKVCVILAQVSMLSASDAAHEQKHCDGWDHQ